MKKSLLALAGLSAFAGVAQADDSYVQLYGILDVAVGSVTNQYDASATFPASVNPYSKTQATGAVTGMFNGGISDSRWGLKGAEDLGGGLKAIFVLESGFNAPTGALNNAAGALATSANGTTYNKVNSSANSSLNGQLFNRQAWIGLSDAKYGTLTAGRNYSPFYDIAVSYDPVQNAQLFSPLGFSGTIGGGGGVSENTRLDNSLKYTNKVGGVNFGGVYKFGMQPNGGSQGQVWGVNAGYEMGDVGFQVAYLGSTDALYAASCDASSHGCAAGSNAVNVTNANTNAVFTAAKYKATKELTLKAGWEWYKLSTPSTQLTAGTGLASNYYGYSINYVTNLSSANVQSTNVFFLGGDYNFMPNLNLAVGLYKQQAGNCATTSNCANNIYTYSALLDYNLSKRTDVYTGVANSQYSGAYFSANPAYQKSNTIYAVGIRHKF